MKQYIALISALVLVACGGGSGSNSGPAPVSLNPNLKFSSSDMDFYSDIGVYGGYKSNLKFNVDASGKISSLTTTNYDGETLNFQHTNGNSFQINNLFVYESDIDLDEVKTYLQSQGLNYMGKISTSVTSTTQLTDAEVRQILIERNIDLVNHNPGGIPVNIWNSNGIREMVTHIVDNSTWEETTLLSKQITMDSIGKNLQLKYSDFGTTTTISDYTQNNMHNTVTEYGFYFGGHEASEVAKPTTEMTFKGSAIAKIGTYGQGDNNTAMLSKTNDAKLQLVGGTEILTMNFSKADNPWYDIVINNSMNQATISVTDNTTANINGDQYKLTSDVVLTDYFTAKYYGENVAEEAMATTHLDIPKSSTDGMIVDAVFGGTAQ